MRILVYGAGVLGCELAHVLLQNLAKAAALCGARLAFILPDGSKLIISPDEE